MRALLDTRTFLWWNMDDPQLSHAARQFIADGRNELFFSAASAWEIAIKAAWRGIAFNPCPYSSAMPCASTTCPICIAIPSTSYWSSRARWKACLS